MRSKILLVAVVIVSSLASLGSFAYATTFMNHQVNVRHLQGLSGGFYDDTGLWSIAPDSVILDGTGLIVYPIDRVPLGATKATAVVLTSGSAFNPVTNGVTAGDWVLRLTVANTSAIRPSTTWAFHIQIGEDGGLFDTVTLYFATPGTLGTGGYQFTAIIDPYFGGPGGQSLLTPLTYTAIVENT